MTNRPNDDRDTVHPQFRSKPALEKPLKLDGHDELHPFFATQEPPRHPSVAEIIDSEYARLHASRAVPDPVRGGWVSDVEESRANTGQKAR